MYITKSITNQVDDLLSRIGEKLQLDQTRRQKAESAYNSIADELESDGSFFNHFKLEVYPHGSFRLDTTVKPYKEEEYDLDFIAHVLLRTDQYSPTYVLDRLEQCLRSNGTYEPMVERKNRCVRLNYKGNFHLDIQPGSPIRSFEDNDLKVPDRQTKLWMESNPRGFAMWFENKYLPADLVERRYQEMLSDWRQLTEKTALPQSVPYNMKQPIQRAVQLIKRYRDVYFYEKGEQDFKPSSIILTTLSGKYYFGDMSEFETIRKIISSIYNEILTSGSDFQVFNPVNLNERFTDKWDSEPRLRNAFNEFIRDFHFVLNELSNGIGYVGKAERLKKLFGTTVTDEVLTEQANYLTALRNSGRLGITDTGMITTSLPEVVSTIKKNTFYGDE